MILRRIILRYAALPVLIAVLSSSPAQFADARGNEVRVRGNEYGNPLMGEAQGEYYLGIGDQLRVFVLKNPDLCGTTVINPDGKISYPLVGTMEAANLTITQFQDKLKEKFSAFIRYPEVTVTVEASAGKKIVVLGEVDYPGVYSYEGQISLIEAIALSGDFTRDAKRESVIIVSDNFTPEPKTRRVNVFNALREGTSTEALLLNPGDVVYVPRQFIADVAQCGRNLSAIMGGADSVTDGLIDWRREVRWLYNRNLNVRGSKAFEKDKR